MAVSTGSSPWASPEVPARNGEALRASLAAEIAGYESKYGFTEAELMATLATRELEETYEICEWLMAAETLRMLGVAG